MKSLYAALGVLAALMVTTPAMAQQETHWKFFGAVSYVSPLGEEDVDFGSVTDSVQASSELGYEFGIEYRFNKRIAIELSYVDADTDVEVGDTTFGESGIKPANLALNFYLIPGTFFELYVAPVVSYVSFDDLELSGGGSQEIDSETAYGAQLGIDIGFGKNFAIMGGVRWLSLDATTDDGSGSDDEFAVDPLFARLGVAFRF